MLQTLDPPSYVVDMLSLRPKHPINDKFNETHFMADFDTFLRRTKSSGATPEQLNKLNSKVVGYVKSANKQRTDRLISKVNQILNSKEVNPVPVDKGSGYCPMSDFDYNNRLLDILKGRQIESAGEKEAPLFVKIEDQFNKELLSLLKANPVSQALYDDVDSKGATPPRLYGLAKVHQPDTPLRPVLSLPGS